MEWYNIVIVTITAITALISIISTILGSDNKKSLTTIHKMYYEMLKSIDKDKMTEPYIQCDKCGKITLIKDLKILGVENEKN